MGIRITAFAFNASRLQRVLDLPLWQILGRLCQLPAEDKVHLFSVHDPEHRHRFHASPARGVIRIDRDRPVEELDESALRQIALLRQTTAQYLTSDQGNSYELAFLLHALATETTSNVTRLITDGYRRWWIGSLLASAHNSGVLSASDFEHLRVQCARILRIYDCGFPLDDADRRSPRTLPYLPTQDGDYYMNLFDVSEANRFADLIGRLQQSDLQFAVPPPRFLHKSEEDWNALVRDRIAEFLTWRSLSPPHDHLITFIG